MTLELRPYQQECLERLKRRYREGKRRVLVSLPTGTGKTIVFAHFPRYFRMKKRLLVLAHREELLQQAKDKFEAVAPQIRAEIEQAGRRASPRSQVVVASVPTLGRKGSARLAALDPDDFYLIVVPTRSGATGPPRRPSWGRCASRASGCPGGSRGARPHG